MNIAILIILWFMTLTCNEHLVGKLRYRHLSNKKTQIISNRWPRFTKRTTLSIKPILQFTIGDVITIV